MASGVDGTSRALCYSAAAPIQRAAECARPAHSHTCRRAEGEQSRERVNPVAIIAWRLRLFVPAAEDRGPPILAALLKRHPLLGARARAAA